MSSDPIADMLVKIMNAGRVRKEGTQVSHSKIKEEILKIMKSEGFIEDWSREENELLIKLRYFDKTFGILGAKRVSKPGLRKYSRAKRINKDFPTVGISIVTTPKGLMTGKESQRQGLGGEVLCQIW